ncbi:hypothetical protein yc1106_05912 [Curvularia clavata]|uniref:Peptidase S8/S53 domain-containing protein n=1 Tax=Curvularia clavata TaxID=95742 RepID=A0A9Q9DSH4_CURCL|nr:hypothetical protein yc1106_05912 [Curvularia clavata]
MKSIDERIDALGEKAMDLERRAEDGDQRLLEEAANAYGEAVKLAEKHWGNLDEKTLTLRERWADSVRNTGNLAEATICHSRNADWTLENLKQHRLQHSPKDLIRLAIERHLYAQRQLAETYLADKRFSAAIYVYEKVIDSGDQSREELYKDRADLASALFESGSDRNIMRAVNLNVETLQDADKNLGKSHIETVKIRFNLARELYALSKYGDASDKLKELLKILEASECQARSAPEYHIYLEKTKKSLRNCSKKIALQQEELKKAEKIRRQLQKQVEEKKHVVREGKETSGSAHKTDKKNQGEQPGKVESPEVQENQRSRVPDTPKQPKHTGNTTDQELTQEKLGEETRRQVAETSSRTKQQRRTSEPIKEASQTPTKPKKRGTVDGPDEHHSSTKQKADNTKTASVATPELHFTDQPSKSPPKQTSKSESPRPKDVSKSPKKPEAKHDLPIRPHSASETLSPHSTAETGLKKMQRSNSTRSDVSRTKRTSDYKDGSIVPKDVKLDGKSTRHKESACSALSDSKTQREKMDSMPTTQPEKKKSRRGSTPGTQPADRRHESDVINLVTSPTASKEQHSSLEMKQEEQSNKGKSRKKEVSGEEKASQIPAAPSIVLSGPEHRQQTQLPDSVKPRPKNRHERERPGSSQSHYHEVPSPLRIVDRDIAKRKERRSRSSDSARVSLPPKIENDVEQISKHKSNAERSTRRNSLLLSGTGIETPPSHSSEKSSEKSKRKRTDNWTADLIEPLDKSITEKSIPDSKPMPAEDERQTTYLWVDALECFESANPGNEDGHQPSSAAKTCQTDSTSSIVKPDQDQPLDTVLQPEQIHVHSTGTLNAGQREHVIPGGWHQDFDEPDSNQKLRKSRSNDVLSQGGLRVTQPSGTGHRRSASVDIPRPISTSKPVPHSKDWSDRDEIIADEWFDRLQSKTHVFLDQYRDDCFDMTKAARRVRIAVLDTGVAKSTAKGPVPSLMKGPRVKIGKVLDPSLPWNVDSKGHGTHAAGLILTVCPYADVYVYRVCDGSSHIDKKHVADAILDAVDKKKVDIISMSLGWEDNSEDELENALLHARVSNVLIFAASSNDGLRTKAGMAYPARALEVIAIDAADVNGRPLGSNPTGAKQKGDRLTALGQAVRSTWPLDLPTEEPETGWKRLAGTSCATPIAAGIAGLVLEFARQRPMCFEKKIEKHLKKVDGMHSTLRHLLSTECDTAPRFRNLDPTILFRGGGDWATPMSPRLNAASYIVNVLRNEYGDGIGRDMSLEIENEMRRRHRGDVS